MIIRAYAVPHPPLIVPEVGRGQESGMPTLSAYREIARRIARDDPETLLLISPHAIVYSDYIHISPGTHAEGSLAKFGAPERVRVEYDAALVSEIEALCGAVRFPAGTQGERDARLDHGCLVPLYFLREAGVSCPIVRIGASGLSHTDHYRFGRILADAARNLNRRAVLVASGDLSHRLREDGPYGFDPSGPELDAKICAALESGDFGGLFEIEERVREHGAECGLAGLLMLAGALDRRAVAAELLSYEGPFGVGYAVAAFTPGAADDARCFGEMALNRARGEAARHRGAEDPFVQLARASIEHYARTGQRLPMPDGLPDALTRSRAGAFVSIHKQEQLRGCIGTTSATRDSLAREILENAVSAAAFDPRFPAIEPEELDLLTINVDVLSDAEPATRDMLDAKRYGVIVTQGRKRGLLLPDLEGVDSVEAQLEIACRKAGIDPGSKYAIERFEVVRHT